MKFEIGMKVYWKEGTVTKSGIIEDFQTVIRKIKEIHGFKVAMPGTEWVIKRDDNSQYVSKSEDELILLN